MSLATLLLGVPEPQAVADAAAGALGSGGGELDREALEGALAAWLPDRTVRQGELEVELRTARGEGPRDEAAGWISGPGGRGWAWTAHVAGEAWVKPLGLAFYAGTLAALVGEAPDRALPEVLIEANGRLLEVLPKGSFVATTVLGWVPEGRRVRVNGGGHGPLYLRRARLGEFKTFRTGVVLGLIDEVQPILPQHHLDMTLGEGDALVAMGDAWIEGVGGAAAGRARVGSGEELGVLLGEAGVWASGAVLRVPVGE